jgi:hypothetical protein
MFWSWLFLPLLVLVILAEKPTNGKATFKRRIRGSERDHPGRKRRHSVNHAIKHREAAFNLHG